MTDRVLSGMRPTGALHLGHYHGALKNWVRLQSELDCYYFVADWHALTGEQPLPHDEAVYEMVVDWLADQSKAKQVQSPFPIHGRAAACLIQAALEGQQVPDKFFEKGLQMLVDGADEGKLVRQLTMEIKAMKSRHEAKQGCVKAWIDLAPAMGMIGTLIGLFATIIIARLA